MDQFSHKRGDIRDDGYIFRSYRKTILKDGTEKLRECWDSPIVLEKQRKYSLERHHKIKSDPLYRHKKREYTKSWRRLKKNDPSWVEYEKERCRKKGNEYVKRYPEKANANNALRRAKRKQATKLLTIEEKELIKKFYFHAKRLTYIFKIKHHVDHIIPLAKGGLHHPSNLQVIPASVNLRKGIK